MEHRGREEGRRGIQRHPMREQPQRGGEHFLWRGRGGVDGLHLKIVKDSCLYES